MIVSDFINNGSREINGRMRSRLTKGTSTQNLPVGVCVRRGVEEGFTPINSFKLQIYTVSK